MAAVVAAAETAAAEGAGNAGKHPVDNQLTTQGRSGAPVACGPRIEHLSWSSDRLRPSPCCCVSAGWEMPVGPGQRRTAKGYVSSDDEYVGSSSDDEYVGSVRLTLSCRPGPWIYL